MQTSSDRCTMPSLCSPLYSEYQRCQSSTWKNEKQHLIYEHNNKMTFQPTLTLKANIGDKTVLGIVDTSSHCSLMSLQFWNELTFASVPANYMFHLREVRLNLAPRVQSIKTKKAEKVPVLINGTMFSLDFYITDEMNDHLMFGIDFLFQAEVTLDFYRETAIVKNIPVKLIPYISTTYEEVIEEQVIE